MPRALHRTGELASGEFLCPYCFYGIVIVRRLPSCPMCGGQTWERSARYLHADELASAELITALNGQLPGNGRAAPEQNKAPIGSSATRTPTSTR